MANYGDDAGFYSAKRMRNDEGESISVGNESYSFEDNRKVPPSPVIHVRGLVDPVSDFDLKQAVRDFGNVSFVMNFPNRKMALIEFEDINSAIQLMNYSQKNTIPIAGKPAKFNYSVSQNIKKPASISDSRSNNVILLTIMNPRHVITVDVINAICSPIASVVRIVIFRKNGVQSMVEFDSVESATKVKNALQGADIYANSCTIRAEFAKPSTLTVVKNDHDTWDFTISHGRDTSQPLRNQPLLADPGASLLPKPFHHMPILSGGRINNFNSYGGPSGSGMSSYDFNPVMESSGQRCEPDCVLMVYGLNMEKMNCQRLFNLLCLYGNVIKVRYLKSKEGSAMIQMSDRESCERVIRMANGATCFENKIVVSFSKKSYVEEVNAPYALADGTLSYQDFTGSKNNRYMAPDSAMKNRVSQPTQVLYFYNAPPGIEEDTIYKAFTDVGVTPPNSLTLLPSKSERSSRGFLNFEDVTTCTEALVCGNNTKIPNPNGIAPYVLKLAFSPGNY